MLSLPEFLHYWDMLQCGSDDINGSAAFLWESLHSDTFFQCVCNSYTLDKSYSSCQSSNVPSAAYFSGKRS
jgi:hypothetical protein